MEKVKYSCEKCGKVFVRRWWLEYHRRKHEGTTFDECLKKCSNKDEVQSSMKSGDKEIDDSSLSSLSSSPVTAAARMKRNTAESGQVYKQFMTYSFYPSIENDMDLIWCESELYPRLLSKLTYILNDVDILKCYLATTLVMKRGTGENTEYLFDCFTSKCITLYSGMDISLKISDAFGHLNLQYQDFRRKGFSIDIIEEVELCISTINLFD